MHTIVEAAVIVTVVIFLFIGSLRAIIVPIIALPLSIVGVAICLAALGFSHQPADPAGHRARHRPGGGRRDRRPGKRRPPYEDRQVAVPGGDRRHARDRRAGHFHDHHARRRSTRRSPSRPAFPARLFSEFALTLAGAVFISGFVALTLSPVMCAMILKSVGQAEPRAALHRAQSGADGERLSPACWAACWRTGSGSCWSRCWSSPASIRCSPLIKSELAPSEDQGAIVVQTTAPAGVNRGLSGVLSRQGQRRACPRSPMSPAGSPWRARRPCARAPASP